MIIPENWRPGLVMIKVDEDGSSGWLPVAGWYRSCGLFALDFRVFDRSLGRDADLRCGFQLTHLRTGCGAFSILTDLFNAFRIADDIADRADWNFTNPAISKRLTGIAAAILQDYGGTLIYGSSSQFARSPTFGIKIDAGGRA